MLKLTVPDMSCGHCVSAVTKALKGVDAAAEVAVDLDTKLVTVRSDASGEALAAALSKAGYESQPAA
jgi:copper chaperone